MQDSHPSIEYVPSGIPAPSGARPAAFLAMEWQFVRNDTTLPSYRQSLQSRHGEPGIARAARGAAERAGTVRRPQPQAADVASPAASHVPRPVRGVRAPVRAVRMRILGIFRGGSFCCILLAV